MAEEKTPEEVKQAVIRSKKAITIVLLDSIKMDESKAKMMRGLNLNILAEVYDLAVHIQRGTLEELNKQRDE